MQWSEILLTALASAFFTGVLVYVFQSLIGDWFSKRLDKFRKDLEREAFEHETRFTKLHEKRAEVIAELYRRLVRAEANYRRLLMSRDSPLDFQHDATLLEAIRGSIGAFDYYSENRLYFPDEVIKDMEALNDDYSRLANQLLLHDYTLQHSVTQPDTFYTEHWLEAWNTVHSSLPGIRQRLETEFRRILGEKPR